MSRLTFLLLLAPLAVALGGASCTEHGDDQADQQAAPGARSSSQMIPRQQIDPRVQSLPRR
ncbi:hypothetical secreted protein [Pseudomonas knackmussii B13]|uniref:Hypothetical secreted protein n=1 Tax=Pseudomonas knackmussii (strain DSM 6978 / CCUG 54928 / LMG 23759 / B13) TaxID=1301098 RepID=A0A024HGH1_PSEKB|nr:hypothetical protein [Pseudomonas knackmussii]CDF83553.1 hypothetical secreted protein [Pseudomonas knackmussii B13]